MYTLVANSGVDNTTRSCNLTSSASHLSKKKKKVKMNQNAPKIVIRIMLVIRIMVMIRIMLLFSKLEKRISACGSSATQAMVPRVPAARDQLPVPAC